MDEEDDNISSRSPVETDENSQIRPSPPSKSRLSLNLIGKSGTGASPKSPRKLSKFLRSSFSRLLQLNNNNESDQQQASSPTSSICRGPSMLSLDQVDSPGSDFQVNPATGDYNVMTPTTLAFMEEAKLSGLPVIPFAYPTCVLVDKLKNKDNVKRNAEKKPSNLVLEAQTTSEKVMNKKFYEDFEDDMPKSPPGTLESIEDMAREQLRQEQPDQDLELDADDFFCGSIGSVSTLSESNNNARNRHRSRIVQASWDQAEADAASMYDLVDPNMKWHDYLDMSKKYGHPSHCNRSEPIRIKDKQY